MIKFLKFLLLVIVIAFAFALGVRFSDSFKGTMGNLKSDEKELEAEIKDTFASSKNKDVKKEATADNSNDGSLNVVEKKESSNNSDVNSDYANVEVVESMDGVNSEVSDSNVQVQDSNKDFDTITEIEIKDSKGGQMFTDESVMQNKDIEYVPSVENAEVKKVATDNKEAQQVPAKTGEVVVEIGE